MKKIIVTLLLALFLCITAGPAMAFDFGTTPDGEDYGETKNVPEPATMLLLGSGIAGLVIMRKKRNK